MASAGYGLTAEAHCPYLDVCYSLSNARENFEVEVETRMFQGVRLRVACFGVYSPRVALRSEESNEYTWLAQLKLKENKKETCRSSEIHWLLGIKKTGVARVQETAAKLFHASIVKFGMKCTGNKRDMSTGIHDLTERTS